MAAKLKGPSPVGRSPRYDLLMGIGFLLLVAIGVATVVVPELSDPPAADVVIADGAAASIDGSDGTGATQAAPADEPASSTSSPKSTDPSTAE